MYSKGVEMYQTHPKKSYIAQGLDNYEVRPELIAECGYKSNTGKVVTHDYNPRCCGPIDTELVVASHELIFRRHRAILEWAGENGVSIGLLTMDYHERGSELNYHTGIPTVTNAPDLRGFTLQLTDMGIVVFDNDFGDDDTVVIVGVLTEIPSSPHYNGKLTITDLQADKQFEFGPTAIN